MFYYKHETDLGVALGIADKWEGQFKVISSKVHKKDFRREGLEKLFEDRKNSGSWEMISRSEAVQMGPKYFRADGEGNWLKRIEAHYLVRDEHLDRKNAAIKGGWYEWKIYSYDRSKFPKLAGAMPNCIPKKDIFGKYVELKFDIEQAVKIETFTDQRKAITKWLEMTVIHITEHWFPAEYFDAYAEKASTRRINRQKNKLISKSRSELIEYVKQCFTIAGFTSENLQRDGRSVWNMTQAIQRGDLEEVKQGFSFFKKNSEPF